MILLVCILVFLFPMLFFSLIFLYLYTLVDVAIYE